MRKLAIIVVALAACAVSASAQRSGLLLGLSSDSGYRTLWIAPVGGKLRTAASNAGLIVPRADGFHHVGTVRWCAVDERKDDNLAGGFFVDEYVSVADRPLGATLGAPSDSSLVPCDSAQRIVTAWQDSVTRAQSIAMSVARTAEDSSRAEAPYVGESDVCAFSYTRITYLSPRYLSTYSQSGESEYCAPASYTRSDSRSLARADSEGDLALRPYFTAPAWRRLVAKWEQQKGECAMEGSPDFAWGIVRGNGKWRLDFATSGANVCRGMSGNEETGFQIDETAPAVLARGEPAARWRPLLAKSLGKLDDVFVSAAGDLVVARTGDRLVGYAPHDGQLGEPALTIDLRNGEQVVMAEWATGQYVDRWTSQLSALHERW